MTICGYTWGLCSKRSGKGHSHPHLCGEPKAPHLHACTACGERE